MARYESARAVAQAADAVAFAVVSGDPDEARRVLASLLRKAPDPESLREWGRRLGLAV